MDYLGCQNYSTGDAALLHLKPPKVRGRAGSCLCSKLCPHLKLCRRPGSSDTLQRPHTNRPLQRQCGHHVNVCEGRKGMNNLVPLTPTVIPPGYAASEPQLLLLVGLPRPKHTGDFSTRGSFISSYLGLTGGCCLRFCL